MVEYLNIWVLVLESVDGVSLKRFGGQQQELVVQDRHGTSDTIARHRPGLQPDLHFPVGDPLFVALVARTFALVFEPLRHGLWTVRTKSPAGKAEFEFVLSNPAVRNLQHQLLLPWSAGVIPLPRNFRFGQD